MTLMVLQVIIPCRAAPQLQLRLLLYLAEIYALW